MKRNNIGILTFWIIPIVALFISAWAIYEYMDKQGPIIRLEFDSAEGIEVGKTELKYHGIPVGKVIDLDVTSNLRKVVYQVRLIKNASHIAREGVKFWVVRPKAQIGTFENIETIVSGVYIACELPKKVLKGKSTKKQFYFLGTNEEDVVGENVVVHQEDSDLVISIKAPHVFSSTMIGSSILYKGVKVGFIDRLEILDDGSGVIFDGRIKQEYAYLVRTNSIFWDIKAINLKWGLGKGLEIKTLSDPLKAILEGGIAFSTPEKYGFAVKSGYIFHQRSDFDEAWLSSGPKIRR